MLYYTHAFCLIYSMGRVYQKTGNTFSTYKTRGKIVPVVKLRHAKVEVSSRRYPRKTLVACVRPGIASAGGSFPREDLWRSIGGVEGVLCCCCGASCLRCCFGRSPRSTGKAVVLVRN